MCIMVVVLKGFYTGIVAMQMMDTIILFPEIFLYVSKEISEWVLLKPEPFPHFLQQ